MQMTQAPTIEQLVAVVQALPPDRAREVLDFARFIATQIEDPTFADVMTADEIARMNTDDIAGAKAALAEPGERLPLNQFAAELGIAR